MLSRSMGLNHNGAENGGCERWATMPELNDLTSLDLKAALKEDKESALRRELAEAKERLDAADSKACVSCGVRFERGEGHMCPDTEGDGKATKKKLKKKPPKAKGEPAVTPVPPLKPEPAPSPEADDDARYFGFFQ